MTDPTTTTVEIGDVIYNKNPCAFGHEHYEVDADNLSRSRARVASGRWVKVDKKEGGEHVAE